MLNGHQIMKFHHLKYFLAVAETQNIRAASNLVHVTQPAISRQIQELEEELGVELFERLPRGLRLNRAGKFYQKQIQEVFKKLDDANMQLQQFIVAAEGYLSLGAVDVVLWEGRVPAAVRTFRQHHAHVTLDIRTDNTPRLLELLESEIIDGAFVYLFNELPENTDLYAISKDKLTLAYPAEWQCDDQMLSLKSIQAHPVIRFPRNAFPSYYDWQQALFSRLDLNPVTTQWAHNESAMLGLVATGNGFAIVNERQTSRVSGLIKFIDIPEKNADLPLTFICQKKNDNPALSAFINVLQKGI